MATIKDIARRAGVGVATVSRALNRSGYVRPETLTKIEQVADELGYVPNRQARAMVNGSTQTFGILIPDMDNALFMRIVRGINDFAYPLGYSLLVMDSRGNPERERRICRTMQELRVDGLVLFATPGTANLLTTLDRTLPAVVIDRLLPSSDVPQVSVDHYKGAKDAVGLLLSVCQYPPAMISGPEQVTSSEARLQGYRDALRSAGVSPKDERIESGGYTYEGGYQAMRGLLTRGRSLDGVFAANDLSALGALRAIRDVGLRCPDDVRVVGFDDIEATRYVYPSLTTIRQPMDEIGRVAVDMLVKRVTGELVEVDPVLLAGKLIRRESC
ncbi:LacI family DNA-binding transcriptional regulator [Sulfobacillus harzensis]|uniref:LacI family transcriptional regulator n=1 Tax=Sulfobacillus harzensis TaxID=2729629 RepID=A0A7Y0Q297_9FIRM|nr:LacI family DNA-binding transcriptional regulator [Sulfobacillus harzensis]NMP22247.1 LacI family transcriptional regulator [Sulfobacillus harzensis]